MGLSLLHQTVNPVGSSFTPNLLLYGWFTLYWNCANGNLDIQPPTGGADNQEFIVDIIRTGTQPDPPHIILFRSDIGGIAWGAMIADQNPTTQVGPWTGEQAGFVHAVRHRFRLLHDMCCLESYNALVAY